jgi:hypothetical protein
MKKNANYPIPSVVMWKGDGVSTYFRFDTGKNIKSVNVVEVWHRRGSKDKQQPRWTTSTGIFFETPPQKGNKIIAYIEYERGVP